MPAQAGSRLKWFIDVRKPRHLRWIDMKFDEGLALTGQCNGFILEIVRVHLAGLRQFVQHQENEPSPDRPRRIGTSAIMAEVPTRARPLTGDVRSRLQSSTPGFYPRP